MEPGAEPVLAGQAVGVSDWPGASAMTAPGQYAPAGHEVAASPAGP